MSRNLLTTNCDACQHAVEVTEPPRLATKADVGRYADQYAGKLWCAHAHCPMCGAKYLAWFNYPGLGSGDKRQYKQSYPIDLSYRKSFNDEPDEDDAPTRDVTYRAIKQWTDGEGNVLEEYVDEVFHSRSVFCP